jgi:uncharacterized ubiquitin-like protein YukD
MLSFFMYLQIEQNTNIKKFISIIAESSKVSFGMFDSIIRWY